MNAHRLGDLIALAGATLFALAAIGIGRLAKRHHHHNEDQDQ